MPRSVYCTSCSKTYYPCKDSMTDAQCCANVCKDKPTPKKRSGGAVGPNKVL